MRHILIAICVLLLSACASTSVKHRKNDAEPYAPSNEAEKFEQKYELASVSKDLELTEDMRACFSGEREAIPCENATCVRGACCERGGLRLYCVRGRANYELKPVEFKPIPFPASTQNVEVVDDSSDEIWSVVYYSLILTILDYQFAIGTCLRNPEADGCDELFGKEEMDRLISERNRFYYHGGI